MVGPLWVEVALYRSAHLALGRNKAACAQLEGGPWRELAGALELQSAKIGGWPADWCGAERGRGPALTFVG